MGDGHTISRRQFSRAAALALAVVPAGCSKKNGPGYDELVASTWRHTTKTPGDAHALQRELVRCATLAANSHNTQPWRFRLEPDRITILPDLSRRCAAVDPDDHHLFANLGCATENLVIAANAFGLGAAVSLSGALDDAIQIDLETSAPVASTLFHAIPERQCTRAAYDGKPVPTDQLAMLENMASDAGVSAQIFTDNRKIEAVLEYVVEGNSAQMNDEDFVRELKEWIRLNESAVVAHRDGVFSASSGNPTSPDWLGRVILKFAFTEKR